MFCRYTYLNVNNHLSHLENIYYLDFRYTSSKNVIKQFVKSKHSFEITQLTHQVTMS